MTALDEAQRIHAGDFYSDSDSGKSNFDEVYYHNKPPPIFIHPTQKIVVKPVTTQNRYSEQQLLMKTHTNNPPLNKSYPSMNITKNPVPHVYKQQIHTTSTNNSCRIVKVGVVNNERSSIRKSPINNLRIEKTNSHEVTTRVIPIRKNQDIPSSVIINYKPTMEKNIADGQKVENLSSRTTNNLEPDPESKSVSYNTHIKQQSNTNQFTQVNSNYAASAPKKVASENTQNENACLNVLFSCLCCCC